MKKITKILALVLVMIMCLSAFAFVGCGNNNPPVNTDSSSDTGTNTDTGNSTDTSTDSGSTNKPDGTENYEIYVESLGGLKLADVTFAIYEGDNMKDFGTTDKNGKLTLSLKPGDYTAKVRNAPDGYSYDENGYKLSVTGTKIVMTSSLIKEGGFPMERLELGDVMHDFEVTDTNGNKVSLSGLFNGPDGIEGTEDDKKAVLINFFFTTCGPCQNEIPYMISSYEKYKDDVAVLAISPYPDDDESKVRVFASTMGLTFPAAKVPVTWALAIANASGTTSYPTNVMIDRYGVVTIIEIGGITSETPFNLMFDYFSKDNYEQILVESLDQITPVEVPDIDMPSSNEIGAAINSGNIIISYYPEDDEMAWPFIVKEDKEGNKYIATSNGGKMNSYCQINATVYLEAGQALAFNYFANTEKNFDGEDIVYVFVDGKDIFTISGVSENWETCYAFVAEDEGEYEVSILYLKNDVMDKDPKDDGFFIDDMRIVDASTIDTETYISRYAATKPNADGFGYQKYATVVLGDDGFYHVGTKTGPLLFAELINVTQFAKNNSITLMVYNNQLTNFTEAERNLLIDYCSYASNSKFYGLCPVTEDLKKLLIKVTEAMGVGSGENEWLEICEYYSAYGTDKQMENPIQGLSVICPFEAVLNTEEKPASNYVEYVNVIMPKGYLYEFVPKVSGVYRVTTNSAQEVLGWIFLDEKETLYVDSALGERLAYLYTNNDMNNCTMVAYLEAGKSYYIDIAFYETTAVGSFTFNLDYVAEEFDLFIEASPGPFTFEEGENFNPDTLEGIGKTIAGGVDVILGDDGYYYVKNPDGTKGSLLYADFLFITNVFPTKNLVQIINAGGFDLSKTDSDQLVLAYISSFEIEYIVENLSAELKGDLEKEDLVKIINDTASCDNTELVTEIERLRAIYQADDDIARKYFKNLWGEDYEQSAINNGLEDVLNGILHGKRAKTADDEYILGLLKEYKAQYGKDNWKQGFLALWGAEYATKYAEYKVDEVANGIYHGEWLDYTEKAKSYIDKMMDKTTHPDNPELHGCVVVDKELAEILQILMDKFTFEGVEHSWTKLCYYYLHLGPKA